MFKRNPLSLTTKLNISANASDQRKEKKTGTAETASQPAPTTLPEQGETSRRHVFLMSRIVESDDNSLLSLYNSSMFFSQCNVPNISLELFQNNFLTYGFFLNLIFR